jgi:predicted P-loop ATPase
MNKLIEEIVKRAGGPLSEWRAALLLNKGGTPRPLLANAMTALREAPEWKDVVAYDEFARETVLRARPPWDVKDDEWVQRTWTSHDDLLAAEWLQREDIAVTAPVAQQAVEAVSRDASFHPARDYLDALKYDGQPRVGNWLSEYMGALASAYHQEVGRVMLIGAVARIYNPGCKVDTVPILEGVQGALKSTAVRTLFEPYFSDELADLGSKDAAMQTRGVWGLEVSELDAMSRAEVSRIKSFISRTTDRFRPPYGSRIIESPRSCVFWGTTNATGYLKDETGGRRFLPIKIGKIRIDRLRQDRDQLWAEAVQLYRNGTAWWITSRDAQRDAERQQRDRYVGDPWDGVVRTFIATRDHVTVSEILQDALHMEKGRWGQSEQNRIARCLTAEQWVRKLVRTGDFREWRYFGPVTNNEEAEQMGNVTTLKLVTSADR